MADNIVDFVLNNSIKKDKFTYNNPFSPNFPFTLFAKYIRIILYETNTLGLYGEDGVEGAHVVYRKGESDEKEISSTSPCMRNDSKFSCLRWGG